MKLYYSDVLSPRKACAFAKYVKAPVEYVFLSLPKGEHKTPAMLALNPNGKVPTLTDGARVVTEADAIMCYLSDKMGAGLWPHEPERQLEVLAWFSWNAMHFGRAGGALYFEHIIRKRFRIGEPDPAMVTEATEEFRRFGAVLDTHLKDRKWVLGDALSVADFSLAIILPYAAEAQMPLDEFANMKRWHDRLNAFEAWREPWPTTA